LCDISFHSCFLKKDRTGSRPAMKNAFMHSLSGSNNNNNKNPTSTPPNFMINNTSTYHPQPTPQQQHQFGNPPTLANQVHVPSSNLQNPIHTGSAAVSVTISNNSGKKTDVSSKASGTQQPATTKSSSGSRKKPTTAQKRPEEEVLPKEGGPLTKDDITHNDVLSGRGGKINAHPGNMQFRTIVLQFRPRYLDPATRKLQKGFIAKDVVDYIRKELQPPGRFLEEEEGVWYEIGDKKAIKKAGQALREEKDDNGGGTGGDDNSSTPGDINLSPPAGGAPSLNQQPLMPPSSVIGVDKTYMNPNSVVMSSVNQNTEGMVMNSTTSGMIGRVGTNSSNQVISSTPVPPGGFASGNTGAPPPALSRQLQQPHTMHQRFQQQHMQYTPAIPSGPGTGVALQVGFSPKMAPNTSTHPGVSNSNSGGMPPPVAPIVDVPIHSGRAGGQQGIPGSTTFMSPPLSINYNSSALNNNTSSSQQRSKAGGGILNFMRGPSASVSGAARDAMRTAAAPTHESEIFGRSFNPPVERDASVLSGISDLTTPMSALSCSGSENAAMLSSQQQGPANLQSVNQQWQARVGLASTTSTMVTSSVNAQLMSSSDAGVGDSLRLSNIQREIGRATAAATGTGVTSVAPVIATVPGNHNQSNNLRFSSITMNGFDDNMNWSSDNRNTQSLKDNVGNSYMQMQQQQQLSATGVGATSTATGSNIHQFSNASPAYAQQQHYQSQANSYRLNNNLFKYSSNASVGSESAGSHSLMRDDMSIFSKSSRGGASHNNMGGGNVATYRSSSNSTHNGRLGLNPYNQYNNNANDDQSVAELSLNSANGDDLTIFTMKTNVSDSMLSSVSNTIKGLDLASNNNEGSFSSLLFSAASVPYSGATAGNPNGATGSAAYQYQQQQQQQYQQPYNQQQQHQQQQKSDISDANPYFNPSEPITNKPVDYNGREMYEL
jgi:hypothetical protein